MLETWRKLSASPRTLVFAPLVVLTLIFGIVTGVLWIGELARGTAALLAVGGIAAYALSVATSRDDRPLRWPKYA